MMQNIFDKFDVVCKYFIFMSATGLIYKKTF